MKEEFKKKVAEIKDSLPQDQWGDAIKAARREMFPPLPEKVVCSNLGEASEADLKLAKEIMASDNIIIRYLRLQPTVGVKEVEITDTEGSCEGTRLVKQRTICTGAPYGCMVAFKRDDKLYVGWSIRHTGKVLDKDALAGLFQKTFDAIYLPEANTMMSRPEAEAKKDVLLANFSKELMAFLAGDNISSVEELAFAKRAGKLHAIVRALKDNIGIHGPKTKTYPSGKFVTSEASGPIHKDIARALLQWFMSTAQSLLDGKPFANVTVAVDSFPEEPDKALSATVSAAPMVVEQPEKEGD